VTGQLLRQAAAHVVEVGRACVARARERDGIVAFNSPLGPVTTIAFGWLGLEEVMTPLQIAGSALVLVGVVVISLRPQAGKA